MLHNNSACASFRTKSIGETTPTTDTAPLEGMVTKTDTSSTLFNRVSGSSWSLRIEPISIPLIQSCSRSLPDSLSGFCCTVVFPKFRRRKLSLLEDWGTWMNGFSTVTSNTSFPLFFDVFSTAWPAAVVRYCFMRSISLKYPTNCSMKMFLYTTLIVVMLSLIFVSYPS